MNRIQKLLTKNKWTGEELGKLELINTLDVFRQSMEGIGSPTPIIEKEDFRKMLKTLKSREEVRAYNNFISIHEWFAKNYSGATAQQQQAYLKYEKLYNRATNAITAETLYSYISNLPVILTEKQYNDLTTQHKEEILHPGGKETKYSMPFLIDMAMWSILENLTLSPLKENPLKPLKEKLEGEKVTDPHILKNYNKVDNNGYYTLEDGTRSDTVTMEEWEDLVKPVIEKIKTAPNSLFDNDKLADNFVSTRESAFNKKFITELLSYKAYLPPPDQKIIKAYGCTWHYYEDPPKGLNKWEVLKTGEMGEFYPCLYNEKIEEAAVEEATEDMKSFVKEYPEVIQAILKDMERYIKGVSLIPVEEWATTSYSLDFLYNVDYYDFRKQFVDSDLNTFDGDIKMYTNGIAILRKPDQASKCSRIDPKTGYYKAPDIEKTIVNLTLESLFPESENYSENVEDIEDAREKLEDSYYYVKGYNLIIDLISEHYDLEEFSVAKVDLSLLDEYIEEYNTIISCLYSTIKYTHYDNEALKEKKLEVLRKYLYPIKKATLKIPEAAIKEVKESFEDFKAFKETLSDPIWTLCFRKKA